MYFSKERTDLTINTLSSLIVTKKCPISGIRMKEGFFLNPTEADADPKPYRDFNCAADRWTGLDRHYWFTAQITVPETFDNEPLWLYFCTQNNGWDALSPQFLFFLNGDPIQGVDTNHREILITKNARAGDSFRIDLQGYTGRTDNGNNDLPCSLELHAFMIKRDPDIERLYYNMSVPADILDWIDQDSQIRVELQSALNDIVNMLDLRESYSDEFFKSVRAANAYAEDRIYTQLAGNEEFTAACIGHTHIDVAWLWTVAQTREKAARSFSTVLKLMEEYPEYKFMSSQPQLYAFVKDRYPRMFEKIKQRAAEGRWEPEGGMWLEADTNLISGESMVRQILHGKQFIKDEFGKDSKVLWLPDTFGFSAAIPQIMKRSGLKYFMTTKMLMNQFDPLPFNTFRWKGIDGSEVLAHFVTTQNPLMPKGFHATTYNGILTGTSVVRSWNRYPHKDLANEVLMACGYGDGGGGTTRSMIENARRLSKGFPNVPKVLWKNSADYFDGLYAQCGENPRLPRWVGELYLEKCRGTYTSMARNKKGNRKSELLWQEAEFFANWAKELGADYPAEEIHKSWENILLNQFHDILPGSSVKDVYDTTKKEYEDLIARANALTENRIRLLAAHTGAGTGDYVVFNSSPFEQAPIIHVSDDCQGLADESGQCCPVQDTDSGKICRISGVPAKGWKSFRPVKALEEPSRLIPSEQGIETPFYSVQWNDKGFFTSIYDREERRELLKPGKLGNVLRAYEDRPMIHENWDIDIYYSEKSWLVNDIQSMKWVEKGPIRATLQIKRNFLHSVIVQNIRFYADSRNIDFDTWIDWKQHQILLKAEFDVDINANEATYDIQFGNITRPTHTNTTWDEAKFEVYAHKWADLSEHSYGAAILNDCKYGCAIHEGLMTLTLLKSGISPNPTADQEEHSFTYSLLPHPGDWRTGHVQEAAYGLNIPVRCVRAPESEGSEISSRYLTVSAPNTALETVKQAENGTDTILRLFEFQNSRTPVTITLPDGFSKVQECDLMENPERELETNGKSFTVTIRPYEVKTFRIQK